MKAVKQTTLFRDDKFPEVKGPYELPEGWRWVKLGDISIINPSKREVSHLPDEIDVSFIPMAYVDENSGTIINQDTKKLREVKQGYTYFKEGDVLFAKITPCMENGKCAVAKGLINGIGFGSTEFHVIRPKDASILSEYVHLYLRQEWVRTEATRYFTGAVGQQRVPDSFLKRLPVPIPFKNGKPDLEEQKRIVAKIEELFSKIDRITKLRRQAKEEAENLLKAALHHVFSKADEKGWRWVRLNELTEDIIGGGTPSRSVREYWENGTIPWITVKDMNGYFISGASEYITEKALKESSAKVIPKNNIIIATRVGIGKVAINFVDTAINQDLKGLILKEEVLNKYLLYFLISFDLNSLTRETTVKGLTLKTLKSLKVPLPFKNGKPDLEEQKRIAAYFDRIAEKQRKLLELYEQTEKELEVMKQAILNKAFRGQL